MASTFYLPSDQSRTFEHPQVLADRRQRHLEWPGQLRDRRRPAGKASQQLAASAITQCAKNCIKPLFGILITYWC